jgi:hypothetical protein
LKCRQSARDSATRRIVSIWYAPPLAKRSAPCYFDVFDEIAPLGMFDAALKVSAWRRALADRPSVREAVDADYGAQLKAYMRRYDAHLLARAA